MSKDRAPTPTPPPAAPTPRRPRVAPVAVVLVVTLLACYALLAWTAVRTKAPTYDEPLHALGAWHHLHDGDFRLNPEDPPLWHYWAALSNGRDALKVDTAN